jgi:hypothetical protein
VWTPARNVTADFMFAGAASISEADLLEETLILCEESNNDDLEANDDPPPRCLQHGYESASLRLPCPALESLWVPLLLQSGERFDFG